MIVTNDFFIPLVKLLNTQVKIEVAGVDETANVAQSEFMKQVTVGIGTFRARLKNAFGRISDKYKEGDIVKFFYDNKDATRLQFQGRIDYSKEIMTGGQFLEIIGRHRSFILTETKVNYSSVDADPSDILKAIIDQLPTAYGFTKNNIKNTGKSKSVEWNYVNFWDCVQELCEFAKFDCRVDDDLDFHFHARDTIINYNEYIYEGINHIRTLEHGKDDMLEKTRVIGLGQDDRGLPIIHTAISKTEGVLKREFVIRDSSANTLQKVKNLAEGKLLEIQIRPKQARYITKGLETLEPGENLWVIVPRQKIYEIPRVLRITMRFNTVGAGGIRYETLMERKPRGAQQVLFDNVREQKRVAISQNPNKLDFSSPFNFNDDNLTESHKQTQVLDGVLILLNESVTNGTWIGDAVVASNNIKKIELRYFGKDLGISTFEFSVNNGSTFEKFIGKEVLQTPNNVGKQLKPRIKLVKNDLNPQPAVDSMIILFS